MDDTESDGWIWIPDMSLVDIPIYGIPDIWNLVNSGAHLNRYLNHMGVNDLSYGSLTSHLISDILSVSVSDSAS